MKDIKYWIWLSIFCFKPIEKIKLLELFENNPKAIWEIDEKSLYEKIIKNTNTFSTIRGKKIISEIKESRKRINLEILEKRAKDDNVSVITFLDELYPKELLNIYDYPIVLYVKGNVNILNQKSLAIVGCRNCTEYGSKISEKISKVLSEREFVIISGMAKGIDSYAHLGCVKQNKSTIAVLGSGVNVIYPKENEKLYKEILETNGAIISEYFIDVSPSKENFPMRNRIVSGMSKGVIVVEAKKRSGSLITANLGLEQGKEIFAIPGNITSKNSEGTNELIKDGAKMVLKLEDILEEY